MQNEAPATPETPPTPNTDWTKGQHRFLLLEGTDYDDVAQQARDKGVTKVLDVTRLPRFVPVPEECLPDPKNPFKVLKPLAPVYIALEALTPPSQTPKMKRVRRPVSLETHVFVESAWLVKGMAK